MLGYALLKLVNDIGVRLGKLWKIGTYDAGDRRQDSLSVEICEKRFANWIANLQNLWFP